ncbi:MAG: ATP synthase F1 subunit gamma [Nitrospirota bacterium]
MAVLNYRGLLGKIRAAQKTQQITKTMQMVSASRLKKSQEKFFQSKPYFDKTREILSHLKNSGMEIHHPFFEQRKVSSVALVIVTSDRGLCGAYNANIIHFAESFLEKHPNEKTELILIGKKGYDYFAKRNWPIFQKYFDLAGKTDFAKISEITNQLTNAYLSKRFDAIHLVYTAYKSALAILPASQTLLPLSPPSAGAEQIASKTFLEPSGEEILARILSTYVASKVYVSLMEAFTAENSARMIAMKNATDNAKQMIKTLTLLRNKARQAAITQELMEIVTASEALRG